MSALPSPIPTGWFTEPCRAWWPNFQSATCTPGHPLCMMGHVELLLVKRRARIAATQARSANGEGRAYKFSIKSDGQQSTSELIWRQVLAQGRLDECDAARMVGCKPGALHERVGNAIDAGVLSRVMVAGRWCYELGSVKPQGADA